MRASHLLFESARENLMLFNDDREIFEQARRLAMKKNWSDGAVMGMATGWAAEGFPTYRITDELAQMLDLTDTSTVEMWRYPPPYQNMLFEFGVPDLYVDDVDGEPVGVLGTLLSAVTLDDEGNLNLLFSVIDKDRAFTTWRAVIKGRLRIGDLSASDKDGFTARDYESTSRAARIVLNAILYLHSDEDPPVREKRSVSTLTRRKRALPRAWVIGASLKPLRRDLNSTVGAPKSVVIRRQFCVRGHWRRQPCGPNRSRRKLIWIRPHWKGPNEAEAIARIGKSEGVPEDRSESKVRS